MTLAEREAIRQREQHAAKGPWDRGNTPLLKLVVFNRCAADGLAERVIAEGRTYDDAEFIAHARSDVPALLAEVERLNGILSVIRGIVADMTLGVTETYEALLAALPAAEEPR